MGCGNLVYCGCQTECDTMRCSCNKNGFNCFHIPGGCRCDPAKCANAGHALVTSLDPKVVESSTAAHMYNKREQETLSKSPNNSLSNVQTNIKEEKTQYIINQTVINVASSSNNNNNVLYNANNNNAIPPDYQQIGQQFIQHYFSTLSSAPYQLASLFSPESWLRVQADTIVGRDNILQRLVSLGGVKGQIASHNFEILPNGQFGIHVTGHLVDQNNVTVAFKQSFALVQTPNGFFVTQSMIDWQ